MGLSNRGINIATYNKVLSAVSDKLNLISCQFESVSRTSKEHRGCAEGLTMKNYQSHA